MVYLRLTSNTYPCIEEIRIGVRRLETQMMTAGATSAPVSSLGNWEISPCPECIFWKRLPGLPHWKSSFIRRHCVFQDVPIWSAASTPGLPGRVWSSIRFLPFPCILVNIFLVLWFGKFHTGQQCVIITFWMIKEHELKVETYDSPHVESVCTVFSCLIEMNEHPG